MPGRPTGAPEVRPGLDRKAEHVSEPTGRRSWLKDRKVRLLAIVGIGLLACQQLWRHGHDYLFPENFATVEPGRIYRGAWQQEWPMRQIVAQHKIKTIVALAHTPTHELVKQEKELAAELGCAWVHVPIVDDRTIESDDALFDRLEEAAAIVADPAKQPVYFHCHHGINRASMVQMAYRMLYDGWSLEQATAEISKTFGLRAVDEGPDYRHMSRFYEERVVPKRSAMAGAREPGVGDVASGQESARR